MHEIQVYNEGQSGIPIQPLSSVHLPASLHCIEYVITTTKACTYDFVKLQKDNISGKNTYTFSDTCTCSHTHVYSTNTVPL